MPTSAYCRRRSSHPPCAGRGAGFTLVELLVVLAIGGLIVGIAVPNLERMLHSIKIANERDAVLGELTALSYRAYSTGQPITLGAPSEEGAAPATEPIRIPEGWRLEVPKPIRYAFNGLCSGGEATLIGPDGQHLALRLDPPRCAVRTAGSAQ